MYAYLVVVHDKNYTRRSQVVLANAEVVVKCAFTLDEVVVLFVDEIYLLLRMLFDNQSHLLSI